MKQKSAWLLISAVMCAAVSLIGAYNAMENVKLVTVITVLASAFGAGALLVSSVSNFKKNR